ncbi:PREDICTED: methyltransferase-like protein 7A [Nanorana parkeri]|uniref:methyltransferase-like protein 7A n=1 Tax=Nanorana parkeri TaxID=125878 RepID=UPI0008546FB4|nr:PREDICTED: methyltransferase-like protein 7A [Nanorana parkeri]
MAVHIVFFQLCVALIALPIHILALLGLWDPIAKKVLPYLLNRVTKNYNKYMKDHKKELFSNLNEFRGPSVELRVLELGCGTGANFQFYPEGCQVTCVDPNPNFKKFLSASLAESQHVQFQAFVVAPGESMTQIQSGSMDVVICTLVLCSVDNVEDILAEAHRVLRPGGAYYFIEHVKADPSSWNYFFQIILDPTWKYIGDGCKLTKETWKYLEKSKFSDVKLRHIIAPFKHSPVKPHIIGYAVK